MHSNRTVPATVEIVTAALPYVNAPPHLGHALEIVQADALARAQRLFAQPTRLITGTDENSLKNVRAAEARGVPVQAHVATNAASFLALGRALGASFDGFVRTRCDPRHAETAQWLFARCRAQGDIDSREYRGLYCVGCEQFYRENELTQGLCPEHRVAPELVHERNYFFRLSRYEARLLHAIESGELEILPEQRRREVLSFIRGGLVDFSVSRSHTRARGFGIPVPHDPTQFLFVWFDALAAYLTGLHSDEARGVEAWQAASRRTHVIGKGIVRFHAVYWPAILLSAGLPLPDRICAHGYLTVNGEKISKSLGSPVDPFELVESFGSDAVRYFLLRHVPAWADADFDRERFRVAYESELADQLGNLVQRVWGLLARHSRGCVPAGAQRAEADRALAQHTATSVSELGAAVAACDLRQGVSALWRVVTSANHYIDRCEPWTLARRGERERLDAVLYHAAEIVRFLGVGLAPFLPDASAEILRRIDVTDEALLRSSLVFGVLPPGTRFLEGAPLFPKPSGGSCDSSG